jgi:hypothetical protein
MTLDEFIETLSLQHINIARSCRKGRGEGKDKKEKKASEKLGQLKTHTRQLVYFFIFQAGSGY